MRHGIRQVQSTFLRLTIAGLLFSTLSTLKASTKSSELKGVELFKSKEPISLTLEETIPENVQNRSGAIEVLKSAKLTNVATDKEEGVKKEAGFTFPTSAPWCLLTAKFIQLQSFRPNLGDWGCGHGFFPRHALLSGANPKAIDSSLNAAKEANKIIFGAKAYLPEGLDIKNLYTVAQASVTNPNTKFMERKNHINVAFNVIHYLSPPDADKFLSKLYENTADNGIVVICSDTPFLHFPVDWPFYEKRSKLGIKYPGYGVYSQSTVVFLDSQNEKHFVNRSVYEMTSEEEKLGRFKMGQMYKGIYPLDLSYDDGQTIIVSEQYPDGDILKNVKRPYAYATGHQAFNKFDYHGLKKVLEGAGFTVINGWYTDHTLNTLYPHDDKGLDTKTKKSKVVIVAQKVK